MLKSLLPFSAHPAAPATAAASRSYRSRTFVHHAIRLYVHSLVPNQWPAVTILPRVRADADATALRSCVTRSDGASERARPRRSERANGVRSRSHMQLRRSCRRGDIPQPGRKRRWQQCCTVSISKCIFIRGWTKVKLNNQTDSVNEIGGLLWRTRKCVSVRHCMGKSNY